MKKINKSLIVLFSAVLLLTGCAATSPLVDKSLDQQAKLFKPSKDYANIYIYRNEYLGGALSKNIHVNGKLIGTTGPMSYFMLKVKPGKYIIHSDDDVKDTVTVNAKVKKNYFVWQEMKMGFLVGGTKLNKVNSSTGRQAVLECERIKSNL